eukprot:716090-Karenia_brevis.AAC.1
MSGFAEGSWKMKGLDEGQPAGGGWKLDSSFIFVLERFASLVARSKAPWKGWSRRRRLRPLVAAA